MLVKVGLSYYMEGEHSQGAKYSKGVGLGAAAWAVVRVESERTVRTAMPLTR